MFSFAFGVVATVVFYTFFPAVAAVPSAWLRAKWAKWNQPKA